MTDMPHTRTDHSADIQTLRDRINQGGAFLVPPLRRLVYGTAADLLELHDSTGISLDNWTHARGLIEYLIGHPITPNGV